MSEKYTRSQQSHIILSIHNNLLTLPNADLGGPQKSEPHYIEARCTRHSLLSISVFV